MLFGHLAVSALQHHYLDVDLAPTIAGGIFPDLVDKSLCQLLRITPHGRLFSHTLTGLGLSTALVGLLWGRRPARGWAWGYLGHLLGDAREGVP